MIWEVPARGICVLGGSSIDEGWWKQFKYKNCRDSGLNYLCGTNLHPRRSHDKGGIDIS